MSSVACALFHPTHAVVALDIDPVHATVFGSVRLTGVTPSKHFGLNFRGGTVYSVRIGGVPAAFSLSDPLGVALTALPPSAGLCALDAAFAAAADEASRGELVVTVPDSIFAAEATAPGRGVYIVVDVEYSVTGTNGALVCVPMGDGAAPQHLIFTRLRAGYSGEEAALGLGARCVMPCADSPRAKCTYDLTLTLTGADEGGNVPGVEGCNVLGCGNFESSDVVPAPRWGGGVGVSAGGAGGAAAGGRRTRVRTPSMGGLGEIDAAEMLREPGALRRTKSWTFSVRRPVNASAIGFVVGPLVTAHRREVSVTVGVVAGASHFHSGSEKGGAIGRGGGSQWRGGSRRVRVGCGCGGRTGCDAERTLWLWSGGCEWGGGWSRPRRWWGAGGRATRRSFF